MDLVIEAQAIDGRVAGGHRRGKVHERKKRSEERNEEARRAHTVMTNKEDEFGRRVPLVLLDLLRFLTVRVRHFRKKSVRELVRECGETRWRGVWPRAHTFNKVRKPRPL